MQVLKKLLNKFTRAQCFVLPALSEAPGSTDRAGFGLWVQLQGLSDPDKQRLEGRGACL